MVMHSRDQVFGEKELTYFPWEDQGIFHGRDEVRIILKKTKLDSSYNMVLRLTIKLH